MFQDINIFFNDIENVNIWWYNQELDLSYFDFSEAEVSLLVLKLFILPFDFCWFLLQRSSDKEKKSFD